MSSIPHPELSASERQRLREIAERFAYEWRPVPFEELRSLVLPYLPDPVDSLRADALLQLILIDFRRRWQDGERLRLEDYLALFPELGRVTDIPPRTVWEEYRMRRSLRDSVSLEEYRRRFPRQFPEIEQLARGDTPRDLPGDTGKPARQETPRNLPGGTTWESSPAIGGTMNTPSHDSTYPGSASRIDSQSATFIREEVKTPTRIIAGGGGFRMLECIGRGSYGEVWRAEAPGGVLVALKIVKWPVGHQLNQMELRSLELMKRLRHPFLVQLQSYWQAEDKLFMAMELADCSLDALDEKYRREGKPGIPIDELLVYFRESAEALDYLHTEDVIHRDVKPANILLVRGHAKIGDFGTARLRPKEAEDGRATMLGTPFYMAPEMWNGKVNSQSDQYGLAAAYVELRLHRPLFTAASTMEVALQHHQAVPDLNPLPAAEQKVLHKALAKDPRQRFESCSQFIQALSVAVNPPPPVTTTGSRRYLPWLLLALVPLLMLAIPFFFPPDQTIVNGGSSNDVPSVPLVLPPHFVPADGAEEREVELDGRVYYTQIRPEDRDITFMLIPATSSSDPRTFYMQETKVSNAMFAEFAREHPEKVTDDEWKKGALAGEQMLEAERHPDLPVVHVPVVVAAEFADWLGGKLPTVAQWDKAAGLFDHPDGVEGPYDPGWEPGDNTNLAVGRSQLGPLPVGGASLDVSQPFLCRDMAGNGFEWTRDLTSGRQVPLAEHDTEFVVLRGQSYELSRPLRYGDIHADPKGTAQYYGQANYDICFRVVIEP